MYAVATFLIVAALSLAFTQLAAGGLIATGLPPDVAKFQSRSAFSGAGFTTTEAESVVNHPVRRRIIATTMFVGNLGTPTLVVTVLLGFLAPGPGGTTTRTLVAVAGFVFVLLLVLNKPMERWLVALGRGYAQRRLLPHLDEGFTVLLDLGGDFVVAAMRVTDHPSEETVRSLRGLDEALPTVRVLGVRNEVGYAGQAPVDVELDRGDQLVVYGTQAELSHIPRNT
jgi:hypothetical protein